MTAGAGKVAVIGGGVVGTACAYFLARSGWQVTLIDQGRHGSGCSHGNCGFVCPSHVLPLAEPGVLGSVLKAMLRPSSPFAIKPRFDPALWSWLYHFARRCNERDMMSSARGIQPLLESSRALYREIIEREALACEWETRGLLFVFASPAEMDRYAETDRLLSESFHCPARRYDGEAVAQLEPALRPGLAGGWHYEGDAHLRPDRLMAAWRSTLEALGVKIQERCEARGFRTAAGRASGVVTAMGEFSADAIVVATGAWTPQLSQHLGARIPIEPGKGYSLTMPRPASCPQIPLIFPETRVAVTPFHSGYRLGSTMEFAGYDTSLRPSRLQLLKDGARAYLREPCAEPVEETWFGWRPMTYDSLPVIDRSPILSNVWVAAGHNMLGLSMAPATGRLVQELLCGQTPHVDPAPYRISRFA